MAVQKHHDVANCLLLGPTGRDLTGPELADTRHLLQPARVCLDDFESFEPELADNSFSEFGPDAPDHA